MSRLIKISVWILGLLLVTGVLSFARAENISPSIEAARVLFQKLPEAKSGADLKSTWNSFETSSGLAADYDKIFSRPSGSDSWDLENVRVLGLAKRMHQYSERFSFLFGQVGDAGTSLSKLTQEVAPFLKPVNSESLVLKYCFGYLPLGAQGPGLPSAGNRIDICLDSVAVATYDLRHAVLEKAIWNELIRHEVNPDYDLVANWIWSHGIAMAIIKKNFPEVPLFSDPAASVLAANPAAMERMVKNFRTAPDRWKFFSSLNLNLMLAFVDVLGMEIAEKEMKSESAQALLSLPVAEYGPRIERALLEIAP